MAAADDALEAARQLARQLSTGTSDASTTIPASEITRLLESLSTPQQLAGLLASLQNDALACLDQAPREALGLARVAHELASKADDHTRAETALTLAIVLNRMGEFRDALAQSRSAAAEFEKRGEMRRAARSYWEAAWANSYLGHLEASLDDVARARERDSSPVFQARCDWIHARALRDQGKYPEAEAEFEKSRAVFESAGQPLDAARCTRELAHAYSFGERANSESLLQSARQTFEAAQSAIDVAYCDFLSGVDSILRASYNQAEKHTLRARDNFLCLGAEFFVALSHAQLGIIYLFQEHFEESLRASHLARDYFLAHDVIVEVSACDINIGFTYDTLNRYDEALTFYQEAAELSLREGREVRAGRIFDNLGLTYAKQGLYAKAMDFHERALQIFTDKGLEGLIGTALLRIAVACRRLGQYAQAIEHLQRAQGLFLENNLAIELAECEFNLADVHFALDESDEANIHLRRAQEIYNETKLESMAAVCDRLGAHIASQKGDRARALSLLGRSRETFLSHHQIVDAALCDLTEGELRVEWNEGELAREAFLRAQGVLSPGFPDHAWRIASGLGDCAKMAGDSPAGMKHYLDGVRIIAQSRSILVTEQLSNDYFSSRQSVYDRALKIAKELELPESALEIIETSKARILLSGLQNHHRDIWKELDNPAVAALLAREKELRYKLDALRTSATVKPPQDQEAILRGDAQVSISAEQLKELNTLSQEYESIVARAQLVSGSSTSGSLSTPFALDRFREAANAKFGTDWAALDYYLSGDCLTTAVVHPDGLDVGRKTLLPHDRAVLDNCASGDPEMRELIYRGTLHGEAAPSPGQRYLSHLGRLLIPEGLDVGTLIIAPHGPLHALPFHALIAPRGGGYLIERHKVVYAPSLQVLQLLLSEPAAAVPARSLVVHQQKSAVRNRDLAQDLSKDPRRAGMQEFSVAALVVGVSDFGQEMPSLAASANEVEQVRQVLGGNVEMLWGDQATRQTLLDLNAAGELRKFDLIHFATHAILDGLAPHHSRVALHGDALTALDILDLELNARLVTLSACETGLGKGGRGDEITGLARAFFFAGARALLATLWHVEDSKSTVELVRRFYDRFAKGIDAAESLCEAQREMIRAGHPAYQWAGFVFMGQP